MGWDDVTYAYMTVQQLRSRAYQCHGTRHQHRSLPGLEPSVFSRATILSLIPRRGSLTIRRLANADGTIYPPQIGATTELTGHTHYVIWLRLPVRSVIAITRSLLSVPTLSSTLARMSKWLRSSTPISVPKWKP
jgi:hypothetical protein